MIIRTTKDLAHLIRESRSRKHITQEGLATLAGVSRKWVVDLEAGKRTTDISMVLRTLRALGLGVDVREARDRSGDDGVDLDRIIERSRRPRR